jgi:small subunit ribosomal protein S2
MTIQRREQLFEAGVQFGHRTECWCPQMAPFIWGKKDGIHLINVALTDIQMTKAEKLLESIAAQGLPVLWVGTKKIARNIVSKFAQESSSPYFANRWVGGTLTNYQEVKKAVKKMLLNSEIYEKADSQSVYTKRELNLLQKKVERSRKIISGIEKLSYPIGALIVTDVVKDKVAVKEALRMGIPIIGLVDTNANPTGITVVIPCNDDLEKSISAVCIHLAEAIKKGKATFEAQHKIEAEKALLEKEEEQKKRNAAQKASFEKKGSGKQQKEEQAKQGATEEIVTAAPSEQTEKKQTAPKQKTTDATKQATEQKKTTKKASDVKQKEVKKAE